MENYLARIEQVKEINSYYELNWYEVELLDICAKGHLTKQPPTSGDLIRKRSVASQATLQIALKSLIRKKLLSMEKIEQDHRVKKVYLTKRALERFEKLGYALAPPPPP